LRTTQLPSKARESFFSASFGYGLQQGAKQAHYALREPACPQSGCYSLSAKFVLVAGELRKELKTNRLPLKRLRPETLNEISERLAKEAST